jgi:hypothetical protein
VLSLTPNLAETAVALFGFLLTDAADKITLFIWNEKFSIFILLQFAKIKSRFFTFRKFAEQS